MKNSLAPVFTKRRLLERNFKLVNTGQLWNRPLVYGNIRSMICTSVLPTRHHAVRTRQSQAVLKDIFTQVAYINKLPKGCV